MMTVTEQSAGQSGIQLPPPARDFSFLHNLQRAVGNSASCSVVTGAQSTGFKRPGREVDHANTL